MAERVKVKVRKKKNKKKKLIKRFILLMLLALLAVGGVGIYKIYNTISAADDTYDQLDRGEKSKLRDEVVDIKKKPFSILFMGVENYATKGERGRTDSLIVVTLDPKQKTMKMLSIPRDTRVQLAGDTTGSKTKINAAYGKGGKEETIETVEDFLGIPIDYYATVDFDGFKDVIDEIGGIDVDVPFDFDEKSDVSKTKRIYFKKGNMHLNGEQALAYARMRKQDKRGDFGRNDRQKQILKAALDQISKPQNLAKIDTIAQKASKNIKTNFRITQALALQEIYNGFKGDDIKTLSITGQDLNIAGVYYFEADEQNLTNVQNELNHHLFPGSTADSSGTSSDSSDATADGTDSSTDSSTDTSASSY
ncbi:LytR family transcriptional regulator [Bacillus glycinifermentans]|uniref:LCP family protein n=1 Tax=Bacillus glycinifermentans TaxID=1664069 RepID=A0A0J6F3F8_9BACI|nr:LCP family protein [Bacillus glycinifermentans]ATH93447.1 LytR family transcriptional regulator [Bacillus glycinifermentans]KMM63509.1 LytR family transcriptional regulator [Bacillus glycinifermentans]KRT90387.1 LytR family transcriptional regulator [Bacillus glycinifermentans]MEC0484090.1 LCP family protein [Bacillus glycinifermentans]MEC0494204.1 LCP family protein [Bacillus glycinifermentans]